MTTENENIGGILGVTTNGKKWRKRVIWLLMLLLACAAALWALNKWQSAPAAPTVRYRTEKATTGDLTVTVTATGQLQPTKTVEVGSEVSGIIDAVLVDYNDRVKAGQVLARINTEKLDAQVLQDKAAVQTAKAKVAEAKVTVLETEAEYNRILAVRQRSNNQLPSQKDVDTAKAAYERAKVAVISANAAETQSTASLTSSETNLARAVIKSPVDGIVLARNVQAGQTIAASFNVTTMFQIAEDLSRMKLQVNIDEADVGSVKEGQSVMFTVDAFPGRQFPGRITQLRYQSTTTNNVVTYLAEISVENKLFLLRPGMTATSLITVKSVKQAVLAPNVALRFTPSAGNGSSQTDGRGFMSKLMPGPPPMNNKPPEAEGDQAGPRVWIMRGQSPAPVPVKTGISNGKLTEITSGNVEPGTALVVEAMRAAK